MNAASVDVCIVGGGLAGSLAAWRYAQAHPARRLCLIDAGTRLGGNHTWSFHASDVGPGARQWLGPLVVARWPAHRVQFPGYARTLAAEYCTITSDRLHAVVAPALGGAVITGVAAAEVDSTAVRLADGRRIEAHVVIDARGTDHVPGDAGWQTFLGLELECARPHGVTAPMLMDATVPQAGGFRFMYVLPFSPTRLLVEDTWYVDDRRLDIPGARAAIAAYAEAHGWEVREIVREEQGWLPIPLRGSIDAYWTGPVPRLGVRGGFFHPTTGFSLPDAVATADALAAIDSPRPDQVYAVLRTMAEDRWRRGAFFRRLNRWMFRGAEPETRSRVLAHFYTKPEATIARFYRGRPSWLDKVRVLSGRPPIPIGRALRHWRA